MIITMPCTGPALLRVYVHPGVPGAGTVCQVQAQCAKYRHSVPSTGTQETSGQFLYCFAFMQGCAARPVLQALCMEVYFDTWLILLTRSLFHEKIY